MTQSWNDAGKEAARRRRIQVLGLVAVIIVCAAIWSYGNRGSSAPTEEVSSRNVGGGRTVDTSPFDPAAADVTGSTTIPDGAFGDDDLRTSGSAPPSSTTTTSTTIPIPAAPADDPICAMATVVLEALRIVTGPGGSSPGNLQAGSARFAEAADVLERSSLTDVDDLIQLTRTIAMQLPAAKNDEEAAAIYNQLLSPTDPAILPVAAAFGSHVQRACPALLTIEP